MRLNGRLKALERSHDAEGEAGTTAAEGKKTRQRGTGATGKGKGKKGEGLSDN
jgi:hypothetical protein